MSLTFFWFKYRTLNEYEETFRERREREGEREKNWKKRERKKERGERNRSGENSFTFHDHYDYN